MTGEPEVPSVRRTRFLRPAFGETGAADDSSLAGSDNDGFGLLGGTGASEMDGLGA